MRVLVPVSATRTDPGTLKGRVSVLWEIDTLIGGLTRVGPSLPSSNNGNSLGSNVKP